MLPGGSVLSIGSCKQLNLLSILHHQFATGHSPASVCLQAFVDSSPEQLQRVVSTNMVGTLLCTRAAMQVMQNQTGGGHIFNMDGAGADGMPTPQYAAYGATKAGMGLLPYQLLQHAFMCRLHQYSACHVMLMICKLHLQAI